jgi:hypothetical protein
MRAVDAVTRQIGARFYAPYHYEEGDARLVGSVSHCRCDQILVAPSEQYASVLPDEHYDSVMVAPHLWGDAGTADDCSEHTVQGKLQQFADALERHLQTSCR